MKIVLHACCAPCTVYPLTVLRAEGLDPEGFFYNPNIHPFQEFQRRLTALDELATAMAFETEVVREYGLTDYLRQVIFHEGERCAICYEMRLAATARHARAIGAEAFTTTLLYSRYQQHETIRRLGERLGQESGVTFYYRDFREGWQEGIELAKAMGLYRQPYCGCIYSEQERYDKGCRKKKAAAAE